MKAVAPKEEQSFVCDDDKKLPKAKQVVFWFKPITQKQRFRMFDLSQKMGEAEVIQDIAFDCLTKIENYKDIDPKDVEAIWNDIEFPKAFEVCNHIISQMNLGEEEAKN